MNSTLKLLDQEDIGEIVRMIRWTREETDLVGDQIAETVTLDFIGSSWKETEGEMYDESVIRQVVRLMEFAITEMEVEGV